MNRLALMLAATLSLLCVGCQSESKKSATTAGAPATPKEDASTAEPIEPSARSIPTFEGLLAASPLSAAERQKARDAVGNPAHESANNPTKARIAEVKTALGDKAIAALAHLLIDDDLGSSAIYMMLEMDRNKAAPYIFASIPTSDRNVQRTAFRLFNLWMQDGEKVCCATQIRAAAIRSLASGTNADAAEHALYALGLTGNARDIPLLRKHYEAGHTTPFWSRKLQLAAEAAMARFGDETAIANLKAELAKPVAKSITSEESQALSEVIAQVGFSKEMSLMQDVCMHLDDPGPKDFTDSIPMFPSTTAAAALSLLHGEAASGDRFEAIKRWKLRCAKK